MDVLKVLYPHYDFVFIFDHSCGHDKKRPDGLNPQRLTKSFGGRQPKMRDTKIDSDKYLGPFVDKVANGLRVGDTQKLSFTNSSNEGPFWMSSQEKINRMHDQTTGWTRKRNRTAGDLVKIIKDTKGIVVSGNAAKIKKIATDNGIPLTEMVGVTVEGWVGKPKGLFQILYERGWIDPSKPPITVRWMARRTSLAMSLNRHHLSVCSRSSMILKKKKRFFNTMVASSVRQSFVPLNATLKSPARGSSMIGDAPRTTIAVSLWQERKGRRCSDRV